MATTIRLLATVLVHQGALRPANEDTVAVADWLASEPMSAPHRLERTVATPTICLVADGVGGHAAGEVASRGVALHLTDRASEAVDDQRLEALLLGANARLFAAMEEAPRQAGMGTTVAGICVRPSGITVFNVGDSRVYRIRAGMLTQVSTDDTPGPKLADGRTAAARTHLITQTLGGGLGLPEIDPHLAPEPLADGVGYLLCTDGLTDLVPLQEIEAMIGDDDQASVEALFAAAMANGGRDNIGIVLIRVALG